MSEHSDWKFSYCSTYGKSEREVWLCKTCDNRVVCTSYRGQRSSEKLSKPCVNCENKRRKNNVVQTET